MGGTNGVAAAAERDAWVACVEAQILASLQTRVWNKLILIILESLYYIVAIYITSRLYSTVV